MSLAVVFRRIARLELDEAIAWYENRLQGLGLELESEVEAVLQRIAGTPEQFQIIRGEIRRAVLNRFPYTIHFLVESDRVVILAIFHVKRSPLELEHR